MPPLAEAPAWFSADRRPGQKHERLLLFPYAGAGATAYRTWPAALPSELDVRCLQMPGRGARFREPLLTSMAEMIDGLMPELMLLLDRPYAFFGHSMGAAITHALACEIARRGLPEPSVLLVSGRDAPLPAYARPSPHDLPRAEFLAALDALGGMHPDLLGNAELIDIVLPILRADFTMLVGYASSSRASTVTKLKCPIVAYGGDRDREITWDGLQAWGECTEGNFRLAMLPGTHFFLHESEPALLNDVAAELHRRLASVRHREGGLQTGSAITQDRF